MKINLIFLISLFAFISVGSAQIKIGYINSEAIMDQLPEAREAQRLLDELVAEWQAEIAGMQREWQDKFEEYDKMKLILTDERRAEMERELMNLDRHIAEFRNRKFGPEGELFRQQEELLRPIQDRIFLAIEKVAEREGYDYVFDQSGDILLLYTNEKYDLTKTVLQHVLEM